MVADQAMFLEAMVGLSSAVAHEGMSLEAMSTVARESSRRKWIEAAALCHLCKGGRQGSFYVGRPANAAMRYSHPHHFRREN